MTRSKNADPTTGHAKRTRSIPTPRSGLAIAGAADHFLQPATDALLHLREARRDEEHSLVIGRVVRGPRDFREVERLQFRLRREASELAERGQQSGAVGFRVAVLARDAELERVPVHALELAESLFIGVQRRFAEKARQLYDLRPEEARGVAHELVHDVGLRRIARHRVVADVLGRENDSASERAEETASGDESGDRQHLDAGARLQILVDFDELRNVPLIEVELRRALAPF